METDVGLWPNHGSSGWGWMPGCPLSVGTSPKHYGGDRCSSALVGDWWGLISVQPGVIGVVWTGCGQDKMTWKMWSVATNCWSEFGFHWGWLGGGLGVVDMMLSLIALEVARISQYFQKGVTGHNTWPQWVTSPLWSNRCLKHWDPLALCSPIFTWSPAHRTFWSDKDTPPSLATLLLAQTSCLCQGLLQILYYLFPCQTHAP